MTDRMVDYGTRGGVKFSFFMKHGYFQAAVAEFSLKTTVALRRAMADGLTDDQRCDIDEDAVGQMVLAPDFSKVPRPVVLAACATVYRIVTDAKPALDDDPITDIFIGEVQEGFADNRLAALAFQVYRASQVETTRENARVMFSGYNYQAPTQ